MLRSDQLFEIRFHRRGHPVAGRVARPCCCTIGSQPEHQWTERCDRYPPLALIRADGTPAEIGPLLAVLNDSDSDGGMFSAQPITSARYRYLTDLEMWAHANEPTHPIAHADRRAKPRRSFLDG